PLLLNGETGSGKEAFAKAVHLAGPRAEQAFVALNCAAIPETLIESELFGYRGGSFTGARKEGMRGKLQQADGGTLFLDEIGDMPLALQTRLLRVLEERRVVPLGGEPEDVDVRLISATHRDLAGLVADGRFREDLYYRLGGARFELPPLRERSDRLALIRRILDEETAHCGVRIELGEAALECLLGYRWPGNVRQLRHVLRYACALCGGATLQLADLPAELRGEGRTPASACESGGGPERDALLDALVRHRWKPMAAARELGISRATLYRRVRRHGIRMPGQADD
ncbi:sigma-54-dependent Fis family transcriptional regulator, partial [Pseudomonas aeruginosa]|nr:sigma-54-dependent Fis family transcriptional regulator [Pseudomonas aeruginosa]